MSSAGSPASSPPPCSTCPRAAIASSAPARSTPAKRNHGLLFGGRGWGAPSPDHADSHPAASSRKGPRDYSLPLRQSAEDTGLARVPPAPPSRCVDSTSRQEPTWVAAIQLAGGGWGRGHFPRGPCTLEATQPGTSLGAPPGPCGGEHPIWNCAPARQAVQHPVGNCAKS